MAIEDTFLWLCLLSAAFGAGVLNAIAGGGSFLTLPALIWSGINPVAAGVTSAVVVAPGYLGSVMGYRQELSRQPAHKLYVDICTSAAGGLIGAVLLLITQDKLFARIVPWLLVFATVLFMIGPSISRWFHARTSGGHPGHSGHTHHLATSETEQQATTPSSKLLRPALLFIVAIYGGYFNGGLGIMLMSAYFLVGEQQLHTINAFKNLVSLVLALVSVLAFIAAGAILWNYALPMMAAAMAGGFAGVRLARWLPLSWVRAIVIGTGIVMSVLLWQKT